MEIIEGNMIAENETSSLAHLISGKFFAGNKQEHVLYFKSAEIPEGASGLKNTSSPVKNIITGTVFSNADKSPLAFATIKISGSVFYFLSDANGYFECSISEHLMKGSHLYLQIDAMDHIPTIERIHAHELPLNKKYYLNS